MSYMFYNSKLDLEFGPSLAPVAPFAALPTRTGRPEESTTGSLEEPTTGSPAVISPIAGAEFPPSKGFAKEKGTIILARATKKSVEVCNFLTIARVFIDNCF